MYCSVANEKVPFYLPERQATANPWCSIRPPAKRSPVSRRLVDEYRTSDHHCPEIRSAAESGLNQIGNDAAQRLGGINFKPEWLGSKVRLNSFNPPAFNNSEV